MRSVVTLVAALLLTACASLQGPTADETMQTHARKDVSVQQFNEQIQEMGLEYFCSDGRCDTLPQLISGKAPAYPRYMATQYVRGHAVITFTITAEGTTRDLVVESASNSNFGKEALKAVERWQFEPARLKGEPIELQLSQPFPFVPPGAQ